MSYQSWSVVFGEQPSAAKWNILGQNDASFNDGSGIGAGAILPNHLVAAASSLNTHAWDAWTPTLSGRLDDGDWTKDCDYIQIGKTVFFKFNLVATAAAPMGGGNANAIFTLPVTAAQADGRQIIGDAGLTDDNGGTHRAAVFMNNTTTAVIYCQSVSGSNIVIAGVTSAVPFNWTTSDEIWAIGCYEAA